MNVEHNEFIGIYSDLYPDGYCQHLINEFDRLAQNGAGANRMQSEGVVSHRKDDYQISLNLKNTVMNDFDGKSPVDIFFRGLQYCFDDYTEKFSILKDEKIWCTHMKAQRTDPGGGYHIWHQEQGKLENNSRVIVYMLYLNSLEENEGGETEFLYQRKRYKPQENTMILWPANYTHAHRGNTVLGNRSKYIITGWFYYGN